MAASKSKKAAVKTTEAKSNVSAIGGSAEPKPIKEDQKSEKGNKPASQINQSVHLDKADLEGLPAELLGNLKAPETNKFDYQILEAMKAAGGTVDIDKLIVTMYKLYGEIQKRNTLSAKLSRMHHAGSVQRVGNGTYSLDGDAHLQQSLKETEPVK